MTFFGQAVFDEKSAGPKTVNSCIGSFCPFQNGLTLTASLLVAVVRTVITPVAHLAQGDAVSIITPELSWGAGGGWSMTHVLQLVRLVPTVVVSVTNKVVGDAAPVLAGELVLLARQVGATLLIAAVSAVVSSITPGLRKKEPENELTHCYVDGKQL